MTSSIYNLSDERLTEILNEYDLNINPSDVHIEKRFSGHGHYDIILTINGREYKRTTNKMTMIDSWDDEDFVKENDYYDSVEDVKARAIEFVLDSKIDDILEDLNHAEEE